MTRTNRLILFPYAKQETKVDLIPNKTLQRSYPLPRKYLLDNKEYLENRENGKMIGARGYGYIYPKALDVMSLSKLFTPEAAL